jgi:hypothetical protein
MELQQTWQRRHRGVLLQLLQQAKGEREKEKGKSEIIGGSGGRLYCR